MLQSKHAPIDMGIVIANVEKTSAAMFALLIFHINMFCSTPKPMHTFLLRVFFNHRALLRHVMKEGQ